MNRLIQLALLCLCVSKAICTMDPAEESNRSKSINLEEVLAEQQQAIGILTSALEKYKKTVETDEILTDDLKLIYLNKYVELAATLEENNFALLLHRNKMPEKTLQILVANKTIIDQFKLELAALIGQKNLVDMRKLTEIECLLEEAYLNSKIFIRSKEQQDAKTAAEHAMYVIKACTNIQNRAYFQAMQNGKIDFMGSEIFKKCHDVVLDRFELLVEVVRKIHECVSKNQQPETDPQQTAADIFEPLFKKLNIIKQAIIEMEATPGPHSADDIRELQNRKRSVQADLDKCAENIAKLEQPIHNAYFKSEKAKNEFLGRLYKVKAKINKLKGMIHVQQATEQDTELDNLLRDQRTAKAQLKSIQTALSVYATGDPDFMVESFEHLQRTGKEFLKHPLVQKVLASNEKWGQPTHDPLHQSILEATMQINDIFIHKVLVSQTPK